MTEAEKKAEIERRLREQLAGRKPLGERLIEEQAHRAELRSFAASIAEVTGDSVQSVTEAVFEHAAQIERRGTRPPRGNAAKYLRAAGKRRELQEFERKRKEAHDYLRKCRDLARAHPDADLPAELLLSAEKLDKYAVLLKDNDMLGLYYKRLAAEAEFTEFSPVFDPLRQETVYREVSSHTLVNRGFSVANCGKAWSFDRYDYPRPQGVQPVKDLQSVNYCHDRFCPLCQSKLSVARYAKYIPQLAELVEDYDVYHLTLTSPNVDRDALPGEIDRMFSSFKLLSRYFSGNVKVAGLMFPKLGYFGIIRSFELTIPRPGEFHPHFHCLLFLRKGLDLPEVHSNRYSYKAGGRGVQQRFSDLAILLQKVWCLLMTGRKVTAEAVAGLDIGYSCQCTKIGPDQFHEVFKYAVKPGEARFGYDDFKAMRAALKGRKMFQGYGGLYRVKDVALDENAPEYDTVIGRLRELCGDPKKDYETLGAVYQGLLEGATIYISRKRCDVEMDENGDIRKKEVIKDETESKDGENRV